MSIWKCLDSHKYGCTNQVEYTLDTIDTTVGVAFYKKNGYYRTTCKECERRFRNEKYKSGYKTYKWNKTGYDARDFGTMMSSPSTSFME